MLRQLNYYLQVFWISVLVMLIGIQFIYFQNRCDEIIVFYLLLAFLIGVNQLVTSIFHVIKYKKSSILCNHLVGTIVLFLIWMVIGFTDIHIIFNHWSSLQIMLLVWIPPGILACYFWYITFRRLRIIPARNHSYLDL